MHCLVCKDQKPGTTIPVDPQQRCFACGEKVESSEAPYLISEEKLFNTETGEFQYQQSLILPNGKRLLLTQELMQLKEQRLEENLISLGWTPPKKGEH